MKPQCRQVSFCQGLKGVASLWDAYLDLLSQTTATLASLLKIQNDKSIKHSLTTHKLGCWHLNNDGTGK